jgi:hypothetical protein
MDDEGVDLRQHEGLLPGFERCPFLSLMTPFFDAPPPLFLFVSFAYFVVAILSPLRDSLPAGALEP